MRNNNNRKVVIGLVIAAVIMLLGSLLFAFKPALLKDAVGYVVVPFQSGAEKVGSFIKGKTKTSGQLDEIQERNKKLEAENEQLKFDNSRLRSVETENERLSDLLETDLKYADLPKEGAHIIAKDVGNWYNSFLVDKGKKDGIKVDMVVIGDGGLIGRVLEVGQNYSRVVALIDDTSVVSAMSMRTEDIGYVRGDISLMLEGLCRMEYLSEDAQLMEGDEIVTSHLSRLYPPGITIGTVKEILPDSNGTKFALIEPVVDFEKMEMVLIVTEEYELGYPDGALENPGESEQ